MTQNRAELNRNLAQMLKGGVIMDVTTPEQAKIAQDAGACAVMALERIPADIRAAGGVSRMSDPAMIKGIQEAVSIPVMAKVRIGHIAEARILQAIEIDYIDESEVLSPADDVYHIDKNQFDVPFVCGAKNLGEALRRIAEGAAMIRTKGEPGTGDVIQAVRHMRTMNKQIRELVGLRDDEVYEAAAGRALRSGQVRARQRPSARRELRRRWCGHPGRRRPDDGTRCRRRVRGLRYLQVRRSGQARRRHRQGHRQLAGRRSARQAVRKPRRSHGRYQRGRDSDHHGRSRRVTGVEAGEDNMVVAVEYISKEESADAETATHGVTGILAVQGAFAEHAAVLDKLGAPWKLLRAAEDFDESIDRVILPGGESTTQGKLLRSTGLFEPIAAHIKAGKPVLGTFACIVLLAKKLDNDENVYFGALDAVVRRNAYGRQLGSFQAIADFGQADDPQRIADFPLVFIRGPYVVSVGPEATVETEVDGHVVGLRQGNILATAFHPELTDDVRIHELFLSL